MGVLGVYYKGGRSCLIGVHRASVPRFALTRRPLSFTGNGTAVIKEDVLANVVFANLRKPGKVVVLVGRKARQWLVCPALFLEWFL